MSFSEADLFDLAEAVRISRDGSAKALRHDLGLAAIAVGAPCGVTASAVTRWENGLRRPTGRAAVEWVRLLRRLADTERLALDGNMASPSGSRTRMQSK